VIGLRASADIPGTLAPGAGDHIGVVDFFGTAHFVGVALYEDAAGTIPLTGVASVTGGDGRAIAIVPEPVGLAALGIAAGVALVRLRQRERAR
jgi:hypothetical protein